MEMSESPVFEIPEGENLEELSKNMSDQEMKALVIQNFRMNQEILRFCRNMQSMIDMAMGNGGMVGRAVRGIVPPNGMLPDNPDLSSLPPEIQRQVANATAIRVPKGGKRH
jgi:hypothetical protein